MCEEKMHDKHYQKSEPRPLKIKYFTGNAAGIQPLFRNHRSHAPPEITPGPCFD
jgi:hypothetical protein